MRIKIAIRAFFHAPRIMNIERKRRQSYSFLHKSCTAKARCEIVFFTASPLHTTQPKLMSLTYEKFQEIKAAVHYCHGYWCVQCERLAYIYASVCMLHLCYTIQEFSYLCLLRVNCTYAFVCMWHVCNSVQ